jgi:hypothetical protein
MALACRRIGHGVVIGIDPWEAHASIQGMTGKNLDWWGKVDHEGVYHRFLANIRSLDLGNWIQIHRCRSDQFDLTGIANVGLWHSDGNHSEQASRDVERFVPLVPVGGLVFCDDIQWEGGHVTKAVEKLETMGFCRVLDVETGALFKRLR